MASPGTITQYNYLTRKIKISRAAVVLRSAGRMADLGKAVHNKQ